MLSKKTNTNVDKVEKEILRVKEYKELQDFKKERFLEIKNKVDQYRPLWDKDGVIQFKNEHVAILQRKIGQQVEFIVAFDDLTRDVYRLMAIDEGKEASAGGIKGGWNAYFYFQKMKYVR